MLERELAAVRRNEFAVDREEYAQGFCCVAAPLFSLEGELAGVLGLSVTTCRFSVEGQHLVGALARVAETS